MQALPCLVLLSLIHCCARAGAGQAEFLHLTGCLEPVTGYLAGTGVVTTSTEPETGEWIPEYEGAAAADVNPGNPHIAMGDAFGNTAPPR